MDIFTNFTLYSEDSNNGPLNNGTIQITGFSYSVIQAMIWITDY